MKANVQPGIYNAKTPAGFFGTNTEFFTHKNQLYGLQNGSMKPFNEFPQKTKQVLFQAYCEDKASHPILKKMGVPGVKTGFEKWANCMFGNLDGIPDFDNDTPQPDAFNAACQSTTCQFRGKLCGRQSAITTEEFKTLKCLVSEMNVEQSADKLFLSIDGVKSRIKKLKKRFEVKYNTQLAVKATELGITPYELNASVKNA